MSLIDVLPKVRGVYRENASIAKNTWFSTGGKAEVLFKPFDNDDLKEFLANKHEDLSINILGAGSNTLIRDKGVHGVVIKLGKAFTDIAYNDNLLEVGAGTLNYNLVTYCKENGLTGLEFLVGVPGCIGGAIAMNAGCYGNDVASVLEEVEALTYTGKDLRLKNKDFGFVYRGNSLNIPLIYTKAYFKVSKSSVESITEKINTITKARETTQPIRSKTGGSTFKNPNGFKAWELIDQAGCRGLKIGGAMISEKHCNFIINFDNASASDIENLGEEVIMRVLKKSGITLEWEIKRLGEKNEKL